LVANFNRFAGRSTADVPSEIGWVSLPRRPIIAAIAANEGISEMTKAYYSTVFEQPAPEVWKIVRDFNNYPVWVGGAGESEIEDGKSGDTVGAVRNVLAGAPTLPVTGYQATLRITPVVDGDRAFVEWWATFDCDAGQRDQLTGTLAGSFEKWLESLRDTLAD
jgi:hypothetical protein